MPERPSEFRIAPATGARTVAPRPPSFCTEGFEPIGDRDVRFSRMRDWVSLRSFAEGRGNFDSRWRDYHHIARFACTYPNDGNQQAWVASYRQILVNETGSPADVIDALFRFALTHSEPRPTLECAAFSPDEQATPDENDRRRALAALFCGAHAFDANAGLWWLDRRAETESELFRIAAVYLYAQWDALTRSLSDDLNPDELMSGEALARWVAVRHDARSFDMAKAVRELEATTLGEREKVWGRVLLHRVQRTAQVVERAWEQAATRVPELAPMLSRIPDQAFREWTQAYQQHRARMDRAFAFEDTWLTGRRSAMDGCIEPLRENFFAYASSQRPANKEEFTAMARSPLGYILLVALGRCESEHGSQVNTGTIVDLLAGSERQRGPRVAALRAVRRAVAQVRADNARFPFRAEDMSPFARVPGGRDWAEIVDPHTPGYSQGVVARATRRGDVVRVTFRRDSYTRPRYRCVATNQIAEIRRDGTLSYRQNCVPAGTETITSVPDPVNIPAFAAGQIRSGHHLQVARDGEAGYPLLVHEGARQRREIAFMGHVFER